MCFLHSNMFRQDMDVVMCQKRHSRLNHKSLQLEYILQ